MSKFEEIANKAKEKVNSAVDTAKNYDYKGTAEKLKSKATEVSEKAKNYDYKGKAEEIKENISNYDYKEKAKEIKETVKNFDYEEKAKELSNTVKNYDYKGEVENIKKGGLKYFWSKHKKLSIGIVAVLCIIISFAVFGGNNSSRKFANLPEDEIYEMLNSISIDGDGSLGSVGNAILHTVNIGNSNYHINCEFLDDNKYKITVSGNFIVGELEKLYTMSYIYDTTTQSGYLSSGDETPLIMYATGN